MSWWVCLNYSISKQLIRNVQQFLNIRRYSLLDSLLCRCGIFYGWGRKKSGQEAVVLARKCGTSYVLLEDGFIRSFGLGVDGSPSFSIVKDDIGIYYDATTPSRLERLLDSYNFVSDIELMRSAKSAIWFLVEYDISKYNNVPLVDDEFLLKYKMTKEILNQVQDDGVIVQDDKNVKHILIIAQTAGDASLKYGMLDDISTDEIIDAAIEENPDAKIYLKIHPDVLSGKKKSDIDVYSAKQKCIIIDENVNPISLLKYFDKVYTKTSQMGFEALLVGCKCVCFGMPFYAGWGITDDRAICARRQKKLSVEEVFAGAYLLYTNYYNPYKKRASDIFDTMQTIVEMR